MKEQNELNHKESLDNSKRNLVLVRLAQLNTLDLDALRAEWPKYNNGDPAPNYRRKQLLAKSQRSDANPPAAARAKGPPLCTWHQASFAFGDAESRRCSGHTHCAVLEAKSV